MSRMRNRLPLHLVLSFLLLAVAANTAAAQTVLQLRWELVGDTVNADGPGCRAVFTLTNRGTKPLAASGWAIYFSALHSADSGSVGGGFLFQDVMADLHRIVPSAGFAGLAPGATVK